MRSKKLFIGLERPWRCFAGPFRGGRWAAAEERVLHNFGRGTHGADPDAGLIFDAAGNLYGTTHGCGDVRRRRYRVRVDAATRERRLDGEKATYFCQWHGRDKSLGRPDIRYGRNLRRPAAAGMAHYGSAARCSN